MRCFFDALWRFHARTGEDIISSFAERTPSLRENILFLHVCYRPLLDAIGVDLDLINLRDFSAEGGDVREAILVEVRDADGSGFPFFLQVDQSVISAVVVRERLMEEHKVEIICLQLIQAVFDGLLCVFVAVMFAPDFSCDKDFLSLDAGLLQRFSDFFCVEVALSGIDLAEPFCKASKTACFIFSFGIWNTPKPVAGILTPLFNVEYSTLFPLSNSFSVFFFDDQP